VLHPEPLLFVHDEQTELLERGGRLQQPVGADDDVDGAVGELGEGVGHLRVGGEPGQLPDLHRELRHPLGEGVEVLLRQQRGGHQHRHLPAVLHRLERRAHGDLGLAEADVPADPAGPSGPGGACPP